MGPKCTKRSPADVVWSLIVLRRKGSPTSADKVGSTSQVVAFKRRAVYLPRRRSDFVKGKGKRREEVLPTNLC